MIAHEGQHRNLLLLYDRAVEGRCTPSITHTPFQDNDLSRGSCGASVLTRIDQGFLYSGPAEGVDRLVISPADGGRALERYVRRRDDDLLRRAEIKPLI